MLQKLWAIFPLLRQSINFKNDFFPSALLNGISETPILETLRVFQSLREKQLFSNDLRQIFFDCHNPKGIKLITRLRLGLSHLRENKFNHSFQDTLNRHDIESSTHFFFDCIFFISERCDLLSAICNLHIKLLGCTNYDFTQTLIFGSTPQVSSNNFKIIETLIDYFLLTKRFDKPLFK